MSSSVKAGSVRAPAISTGRMILGVVLVLLVGVVAAIVYLGSTSGGTVLTDNLSEPLGGATAAKIGIDTGDGNLTIDRLAGGEQALASGTLEYFEGRGLPTRSVSTSGGVVNFALKAADNRQFWSRLPWAACNGATIWRIHLHPTVSSDINAHSDGGNVAIDLTGMTVTRLSTDTGGGNVVVTIPEEASNLSVKASTGGGNVVVHVPAGVAAKVQATTGLGAVIVDPRFAKTGKDTYQSPDYESAANKVDLTLSSGAGNVSVDTK